MTKLFFYSALLLFFFSSCNRKSAFNYSQEVVKTEKSLAPQIEETEKKVAEFFPAEKFDSMSIISRDMEAAIQKAIEHLDELPVPDVKEGKEFKAGFMKYFSFMKSVYTDYRKIAEAKTEEERNKLLLKIQQVQTKSREEQEKVRTIQQKYANANGFKIE
jgi:hypothetical protein